jgi:ubiquinone/menaquinone biosynthesis C-methylase UbiE
VVGAGTGLDFEFLENLDCEIHAGDITSSMVNEMKRKIKKMKSSFHVKQMDGQKLEFPNESFDYVILHLILAVIPNPIACINEVERVLKPDGKIAVFDKFVLPGKKPSLIRKMLNPLTALLFSDITRDIDHIISNTSLRKSLDKAAAFGGNFRLIQLRKL